MKTVTLTEFKKQLENIGNIDYDKILNRACILVENDAKVKCPVDDGTLRNSITHRVEDKTGYVYTNVEYAPYVEYGTGIWAEEGNGRQTPWVYCDDEGEFHTTIGQHPQPYMRPALDENVQNIKQLIAAEIKKELLK